MRTRVAIATGLLLLATVTGCSSDAPDTAPATPELSLQERSAEYGRCMRDNGVADFPDPKVNADGGVSKDLPPGIDQSVLQAAQERCKQLDPGGADPTKLDPQRIEQLRRLAQCMRDNGVHNFPDPTDHGIQANGNDPGMSPDDPTFSKAMQECGKYGPSPAPGDGPGLSTGDN